MLFPSDYGYTSSGSMYCIACGSREPDCCDGFGNKSKPRLRSLLRFIASHSIVDPHIDGDDVVFGSECVLRDGREAIQWERVSTLAEARDALGY